MSDGNWFYAKNDQQNGPVAWDVLVEMVRTGQVTGADLVWSEGMASWQPASTMPGLVAALSAVAGQGAAAAIPGVSGFGAAGQGYPGQGAVGTIDYRGTTPSPAYGTTGLGYYNPSNVNFQYAGFWIRVLAWLIDTIITMVAAFIVGIILGVVLAMASADSETLTAAGRLLGTILAWLYFAIMESSASGATLGKAVLGLRVVDMEGQRISFGRATGRYFAKYLSALIIGIGFLMVGWTEKKQGLHDMLASTLVVSK